MTLDQIEAAIRAQLEVMEDCPPIAYPNKSFTPDGLYIEFRMAPNTVTDDTLTGGYEYQIGLALMTVVAPSNAFTNAANTVAQNIAQQFPKALRITAGSGTVLINAPTSFGSGFADGVYWRQPVRVSYITENGISAGQMIASADVSSPNDGLELVGGELRVDIDSLPRA